MKILKKIKRHFLKRDTLRVEYLIANHKVELYFKDSEGFISKLYPGDNLFHLVNEKSHLDGSVLKLINEIGKKELNLCIDIGANLGFVSASMSKLSRKVISFEPEPRNIARIKDLILTNHLENIELVEKAVADKAGKLKLYTSHAHAHHSLGLAHASQSNQSYIEVDVVTLDEFCRNRGIDEIDCLKVDVEGFEYEVFQGAKELFKNKKIKNLIFEISHGVMTNLKKDSRPIFDFLKAHNYVIFTSEGVKVSYDNVDNFKGQDLIAKLTF